MLADLRALIPTLAARAGKTETPQAGNPIADYDDLNAGQIVARLSQLTQDQLAAVLAYERAHRNRRAVIEKAEQLTATPPWAGYDEDSVEAILERLTGALAGAVRDYESRHRRRVDGPRSRAAGAQRLRLIGERRRRPPVCAMTRRTAAGRPQWTRRSGQPIPRRSSLHRKTCDALTEPPVKRLEWPPRRRAPPRGGPSRRNLKRTV